MNTWANEYTDALVDVASLAPFFLVPRKYNLSMRDVIVPTELTTKDKALRAGVNGYTVALVDVASLAPPSEILSVKIPFVQNKKLRRFFTMLQRRATPARRSGDFRDHAINLHLHQLGHTHSRSPWGLETLKS